MSRQVAVGHVVGQPAADGAPILVERRDRQQVRDIDLLDKGLGVVEQFAHVSQALGINRIGLVNIERARGSAHQVVRMRVFPAEDRMHLHDLLLPIQRFEIVRQAQQVDFRRQFHRRVAPIAVRKDPKLAALHEGRDPLLHIREVVRRRLRPVRDTAGDLRGIHRVGLERADDIHPVQRVQMVEMHHVVLHVLRAEHQVAHQLGVGRDHDAQCVLHRAHRGQRMDGGADAASPLGKSPRVARVAPFQDDLQPAHHGARAERVRDFSVLHLDLNAQVPFNSGDRVDDNAFGSHIRFPF